MNSRLIIFIVTFILISSCDKDDLYLNNCQDINNDCYLYPLENFSTDSYSPSGIILNIDNLDEVESIFVNRTIPLENDIPDTSFIIHKNEDNLFIDGTDIQMDRWYSYIARNYSDLGVSDNSTSVKYHEFPSINEDLLFVIPIDETSIDINWFYDLSEIFAKPYDTVSWKIIRSKYSIDSDDWVNDFTFDLDTLVTDNYEFYDNNNINLYDSLRYSIYLELDGFESNMITKDIRVNFPQMEYINWVPLNSNSISIHWKIDDSNNDNITSVRITNELYQ